MKEVFIERSNDFIRIAVVKDKNPILFYIEDQKGLFPGEIYKGVIKNIVTAIKGAFVDIGTEENVYMPMGGKFGSGDLKKGDEVIVEILKDKDENKKAKVTRMFSLPGRYAVLNTLNNNIAFSQKLKNQEHILEIKERIKPCEGFGFTIRSKAENVDVEDIVNEIEELKKLYYTIVNKGKYFLNNGLLYSGGGVIEKVLRDVVDEETSKIYINEEQDYEFIKNYISSKIDINVQVEFFQDERNLFHYFGLESEILGLLNKRIDLDNGGFIIIDKTEAMHVIDINSGKNISGTNIKETALKINLEAARESAKQIILRNIGGIILIDFIDMKDERDKKSVIKELMAAFEENKDKVTIYPFTQLNLIQIARRKKGKSILEYVQEDCRFCYGEGIKIKLSHVQLLIKNEIIKYKNLNNVKEFIISLNIYYKELFENNVKELLSQEYIKDCKIYVNYSNDHDIFKVEPVLYETQRKSFEKFKVYE